MIIHRFWLQSVTIAWAVGFALLYLSVVCYGNEWVWPARVTGFLGIAAFVAVIIYGLVWVFWASITWIRR